MLTELPAVVVDLMLQEYLTANDLRAVHQVSTKYRDLINSRPIVNQKRLALVAAIRNEKENMAPKQKPLNRSRENSHNIQRSTISPTPLMNSRVMNRVKRKPFQELNSNSKTSNFC